MGTQKDGYTLGHVAVCTPELRELVAAAMEWRGSWSTSPRFIAAVGAWNRRKL
jgi:hypothetical protein